MMRKVISRQQLTVLVLLDHPDLFLLEIEFDVVQHLDLVFSQVGALFKDIEVEEFQLFTLEHVRVVTDTDKAQGSQSVRLDDSCPVAHEAEHALEHFVNSILVVLENKHYVSTF